MGNISREALRFYERERLIPNPKRSETGYREYDPATLRRIRFIKLAQETGFTLREIREFLSFARHRKVPRNFVAQTIEAKLTIVEEKLSKLKAIKKTLNNLKKQALEADMETIFCPILGKIAFCAVDLEHKDTQERLK